MKNCKAILPDGKACPNIPDEGQDYCPYHLGEQNTKAKGILAVVGAIGASVGAALTVGVVTALKLAASNKSKKRKRR